MRICLIGPGIMPIPPTGWGGVEVLMWNYKIELEKQGHQVLIYNEYFGNNLVGDVTQEIFLESDIVRNTGYRSCFYRSIPMGPIENGRKIQMEFKENQKKFDPEEVYKDQPNPTKI